MDAGLLTNDQINVALNDQRATGMRFGEVVVARGWLKEQTIEWVMEKVVVPERKAINHRQKTLMQRQAIKQRPSSQNAATGSTGNAPPNPRSRAIATIQPKQTTHDSTTTHGQDQTVEQNGFNRREAPISKPLPSVKSNDGDVNWVG
jgi:hypothetical protein